MMGGGQGGPGDGGDKGDRGLVMGGTRGTGAW